MNKTSFKINDTIIDVITFESINSTNDYLYDNIKTFDNDTLVIAHEQTDGHGTKGRNFISKKDVGIYFSLLLNYSDDKQITYITEKVAVSIYNVLLKYYNIDTRIKWVNDIYFNNKKVCGILCKNSIFNKKVIIGIGIDLYKNSNLDDDVKDIAGFLFNERIDEVLLINRIVEDIYNKIDFYDIPKLYIEKRIII